MNRAQRRAQGFRGPLPEGMQPDGPEGRVDFSGIHFYAWRVSWATAHISPAHCVSAFMENPAQWGTSPRVMRKVTRRAMRVRSLQLCVECAQAFVEGRMQAQYADSLRRRMLGDRAVRRAVAATPTGAVEAVAGARRRRTA